MKGNAMNDDDCDINDFLPSILNPRIVKKQNVSLTQNSVVSRCSLSLKRTRVQGLSQRTLTQNSPFRKRLFSNSSINNINLSIQLNKTKSNVISNPKRHDVLEFDDFNKENNCSDNNTNTILTAKRTPYLTDIDLANASTVDLQSLADIGNSYDPPLLRFNENVRDWNLRNEFMTSRNVESKALEDQITVGFSTFEDLPENPNFFENVEIVNVKGNESLKNVSSATELNKTNDKLVYDLKGESYVSVALGVNQCESIDLTAKNSIIRKVNFSHKDNDINLSCEIVENSILSTESEFDENMNEKISPNSQKRSGVAVNLEIKKKKLSTQDATENSKVLILKTDDIQKLSHVIVQPPNYKLVKRQILDTSKFESGSSKTVIDKADNGKCTSASLRQTPIDLFLVKKSGDKESYRDAESKDCVIIISDDEPEMSKNLCAVEPIKCDRSGRVSHRSDWEGNDLPVRVGRLPASRPDTASPKRQVSSSDGPRAPSLRGRNDSASSHSPRKNESLQFNLAGKSKHTRTPGSSRHMPHYKIVAGTHFAVDAFSYGDIPNVKHYFLTHFHSDHYSGLKKSFNKILYCSKITADLCVGRLDVNPKCIHILTLDVTVRIEGVEVTAVDANHCPGAVMLIFTLPNGKTILHTGDFRASPAMESYPLFWNKDIHTIYLDTTYCNSRYDFPTQDQSLEMALALLRQKKMALEKAGKKFSSVLIVCGTYTIGKEKFFLGMARRVGCSVWACPEKDTVLQAVEGRSFSHAPPQSCQLHVVPMRDLTHDKLKGYLETLRGTFSEVVAFKPSGWENGKNSTVEKENITIHGIPYSEHSSFSELIRFVKFLKPKQVVPTVDISGGIKAVQKYFPCPLVYKEDVANQSKLTDYFSIQNRQLTSAVT